MRTYTSAGRRLVQRKPKPTSPTPLPAPASVQGMCEAFPQEDACPPSCLVTLTAAVAELVQVSDLQRRSIVSALRGGK